MHACHAARMSCTIMEFSVCNTAIQCIQSSPYVMELPGMAWHGILWYGMVCMCLLRTLRILRILGILYIYIHNV